MAHKYTNNMELYDTALVEHRLQVLSTLTMTLH